MQDLGVGCPTVPLLFCDWHAAARSHVEAYCGTRLASQTVSIKCDGFSDFVRLSESPVQSVSSVSYVDASGATQTLSADVYELRSDGLEAAIVLKYGQAWPSIRQGSRITVTVVVGYAAVPPAIVHAMLLRIQAIVLPFKDLVFSGGH